MLSTTQLAAMRKTLKNVKNAAILRGGLLFLVLSSTLSACFVMEGKYDKVAPGLWRGVLYLNPRDLSRDKQKDVKPFEQVNPKFQEVTEGEVPFHFEVNYNDKSQLTVTLINGEERIPVEASDISFGRNRATGKDSIRIDFPIFGSYIRALVQERVMEGEFVVPAKKLTIPFTARYGQSHRFTTISKAPLMDISGTWATKFNTNTDKPYDAVGEFKQNGNILRGTFRTETGDYRFLDGEVQGDKLYLSCFDGSHTFLFEGRIRPDGHIDGSFRSGLSGGEIWEARRDDKAQLRSADALTQAAAGVETVSFTFPNAQGRAVSLSEYGSKVKVVQIMGTWCPNCKDETQFLTRYLKDNPSEKLAVVALSFERNAETAAQQVSVYKTKMQIPYEVLIGGTTTNKAEAAKSVPFLAQIVAYPTLVILDKNNKIRRIHTGFDGPATSKYAEFTKDFDMFIKKLISE